MTKAFVPNKEEVENIINLYTSYESIINIARKYKTSTYNIKDIIKETNTPLRIGKYLKSSFESIELSNYQTDILNGLLLSDASISKNIGVRQSVLALVTIHRTFAEHIQTELSNLKLSISVRPTTSVNLGSSRNNKESYHLFSPVNNYYTKLRELWYCGDSKEKQIPNDIEITPTTLYYWFLGDGYSSYYAKTNAINICLCTDSFNKNSLELLQYKLELLGLNFNIFTHNKDTNTLRLAICKRSEVEKFYELIKETNLDCFKYKWKSYLKLLR